MSSVPSINQNTNVERKAPAAPKLSREQVDGLLAASMAMLGAFQTQAEAASISAKESQINASYQQSILNQAAKITFQTPQIYKYTANVRTERVSHYEAGYTEHNEWAPDGMGGATVVGHYWTKHIVGADNKVMLTPNALNIALGESNDANQIAEAKSNGMQNQLLLARQNNQIISTAINQYANGAQQTEQIFGSLNSAMQQLTQSISQSMT